jgi:hypothetical protein
VQENYRYRVLIIFSSIVPVFEKMTKSNIFPEIPVGAINQKLTGNQFNVSLTLRTATVTNKAKDFGTDIVLETSS